MTIERKIIVGIEDIKALVFECNSCLSRLTILPKAGAYTKIPPKCPHCHHEWLLLEPPRYEPVPSPFINLASSIERIKFLDGVDYGFRILLELDEPGVP